MRTTFRWLFAGALGLTTPLVASRAQPPAQSVPISGKGWLDQAFGIWKDRADIGDPIEWQRRERASWTRPWDDDYEDVKAEFPDLFDEEDDRQRRAYLDTINGKSGKSGKE